jgi:diguanylate cyclase (GGDEF)-like protein
MIGINGLLAKMLVLVLFVAMLSLGASYTFLTMQQKESLSQNIHNMKDTHLRSAKLLFEQHLQDQIHSAEEIALLSALDDKNMTDLRPFFNEVWAKIQLSYSLSSMSFTNGVDRIDFGRFPVSKMVEIQQLTLERSRPQSEILCHDLCELTATIPLKIDGEKWIFSLMTDITPSIIFLSSVVGSDIGIMSPTQSLASDNNTLSRYIIEILTGSQRYNDLFTMPLTSSQIATLEQQGIQLSTTDSNYYVWFETVSGIGQDVRLMFIRDISILLEQQNNQKQQVVVIFVTLTFGVLFFLILFSIIPISRINQLKRAIKLIGAKEYNVARYRLGKPSKSYFNDELHELEDEFRLAIDLLETYEQQLNSSQKRLVRQATIDPITGLYTRNVLLEDLGKMIINSSISDVCIFFLDLDGFKPINDNLGHEAGDIMLKKIGYRLKGVVNKSTKVYRIGGDEFVICYCNYGSTEELRKMADSVVDLFSAPFHIYDTSICISASIGICMQDAADINADQLLRYADIAMYQAKERGKNRYEFFDESMRDAAQRRFIVKNDFIASLADNQLYVVFQPIVSSRTREVIKLEALCRWEHPDLGFIPPPIFIDVLEESENMNVLFEWIVRNVIQEILYLDSIGRSDVVISVNLSTSQLVNDSALGLIEEMIEKNQVSAARIELEITETSLITNFDQAKEWVDKASRIGFKVAIDDFGAGYSSLSYLTAFPYNTVKLDRSLLNNIDKDKRQQRIVGSLTQMLHGLSVPIVAEGAETEAQFMELKRLGCDYIQGFVIAKPIPHNDLVTFLKEYNTNHVKLEKNISKTN